MFPLEEWCLCRRGFSLPDDFTSSFFLWVLPLLALLGGPCCFLRESKAAACASTSKLSLLKLTFPHSRGSMAFPLCLDGPSPRDDTELSRLGRTFSCRFRSFCCCSLVKPFVANLTASRCSKVRDLFTLIELSLRARLRCILVQPEWYSGRSGVSMDPLSSTPWASFPRLSLPSSDGAGTTARLWSTTWPSEGDNGLSLRGEGGLEATASLYKRTALVASALVARPSY